LTNQHDEWISVFFQRVSVSLLLSVHLAELGLDDSVAGLLQTHKLESVEVGQVGTGVLSSNTLGQVCSDELVGNIGSGESLLDSAGSGTSGDLDRKVGHLDVLDRHGVSVEGAIVDEESVKVNDVGDDARLVESWDVDDAADSDEFREDHFDIKF